MVINWLNTYGVGPLPIEPLTPPRYVDVDGNTIATPLDALLVINYVNRQAAWTGEGEYPSYSSGPTTLFEPATHLAGPPGPFGFAHMPSPRTPPVWPQREFNPLLPRLDDDASREVLSIWDDADEFLFHPDPEEADENALEPALPELDEILADLAAEVLRSRCNEKGTY
jgi:hypothetical protein